MKVTINVTDDDPLATVLKLGHEVSGDYVIEVPENLPEQEAHDKAIAACREQLSIGDDVVCFLTFKASIQGDRP